MFLTRDELEELTERRRKADQIAWLRKNGLPFFIGANGHPRVSRAFVETKLSGKTAATIPEPNWEALRG